LSANAELSDIQVTGWIWRRVVFILPAMVTDEQGHRIQEVVSHAKLNLVDGIVLRRMIAGDFKVTPVFTCNKRMWGIQYNFAEGLRPGEFV
jgi:hypothetical protein